VGWFGEHIVGNRIRSRVLVSLKTGDAFEGVLWDADRQAFVLRNAAQIGAPGTAPAAVDGELVVLVADVAYVQVLA
jgi:small nuclear ribonucleoprotein (snRNP)-like protein